MTWLVSSSSPVKHCTNSSRVSAPAPEHGKRRPRAGAIRSREQSRLRESYPQMFMLWNKARTLPSFACAVDHVYEKLLILHLECLSVHVHGECQGLHTLGVFQAERYGPPAPKSLFCLYAEMGLIEAFFSTGEQCCSIRASSRKPCLALAQLSGFFLFFRLSDDFSEHMAASGLVHSAGCDIYFLDILFRRYRNKYALVV